MRVTTSSLQIFSLSRSQSAAVRALLDQLAAGRTAEVSLHFIQTILQYDDPELLRALLARIRTGKE
jgi:predicted transcriptional regulator